ncbi:hypothetical protein Lser_V15G17552 [Lactuca serriola]
MHFKFYFLLYTHLFFIHYSNAFNITTILNQYPSFSIFNRYLSETNVSSEINSRQTITVLAVSNDDVLHLSGKHQNDMLDDLMRVHVVLDYFDVEKLHNLQNGTTQMTTLFQTTGRALGEQGFLKATVSKTENVVISSATSGVLVGAILVNSMFAEPFNISVLHISTEIVPLGMNFPVVSDSNSSSRVDSSAPTPKTSKPRVYTPRCGHKVAPSHSRYSAPSPNPHGESPPEGASPAPSGGSANAPAFAESPLLAPKLVPSHSRSPTPTLSPNPPPIVESPPKGAPSASAPASTKSPPNGAPAPSPLGSSTNVPTSIKSPPEGAPSGGSANTPVSAKSPPESETSLVAPSGSSASTPKSPPNSIEAPPISPPKIADTPAESLSQPADTDQPSGIGTSSSSLVVITMAKNINAAEKFIPKGNPDILEHQIEANSIITLGSNEEKD